MFSTRSLLLFIQSITLLTQVRATVYVQYNTSFPSNISTSCYDALIVDLACSANITSLRPSLYYPESVLTSVCTSACNDALNSYESDVEAACSGETFDSLESAGYVPLSTIPQLLRYVFNYTCLTDSSSGDYCNVIAATSIGIAADQSNLNSLNSTGNGSLTCDDCDLKSVQFLAGAAFYHNPAVVSIYSTLTSSCQATDYPLTTSTLGFSPSTTSSVVATPTCTGLSYSIKSTDTCESISKSQGIGTSWLLLDNNLPAYCSNFPTNGTLCLQHVCSTYTVVAGDTCDTIRNAHNMTYAQTLAWNPNFDLTCSNINNTIGYEICVSSPGPTYVAPNVTVPILTTATTAATVPTDAANGTTTDCGLWYEAVPGDYCNLITLRYGIALSDFLVLNPEVNENCTNLYAYESYCIMPVGDISNYPGAFGYVPAPSAWTTTAFSLIPTATYIPTLYTPAANITYANGTRTDCGTYLDGSDYQMDLTNTSFANGCEVAMLVFDFTLDELANWNPSLGNITTSNCSFLENTYYCVDWSNIVASSTISTQSAMPTATGTASNCTQYTFAGEGITCDDLLSFWNITLAQFVALNPEVGSDCSGLETDTYYCAIGSSNSTTSFTITSTSTSTMSSTTSSVTPPGPTQTGIISTCDKYYVAQSGDSCGSVEALFNITDAEFHAWNSAISADCLSDFWAEEAYCVGVSGSTSVSTTATATSSSSTTSMTSSTTTSVTPPGPTQAGIPADCNAYYVAQSGDDCATVEALYDITDAEFHLWNPAVSANCESGFWAEEAYCVGVS